MKKVESEEIMGVADAMLRNARKTANMISRYGVAQIDDQQGDTDDGHWFIFKATKEDVCRVGDCFMIVAEGAGQAWDDLSKQLELKKKPKVRKIEVHDGKD